jgi:hypothetical protein
MAVAGVRRGPIDALGFFGVRISAVPVLLDAAGNL